MALSTRVDFGETQITETTLESKLQVVHNFHVSTQVNGRAKGGFTSVT
jgi:hypothetical protein